MEILSTIERVTRKIAPGRAPSFTEADVIKALEIICDGEAVGRIRLDSYRQPELASHQAKGEGGLSSSHAEKRASGSTGQGIRAFSTGG